MMYWPKPSNWGMPRLIQHFDVEGIDAAHKLTILASIAFGIFPCSLIRFYIEGHLRDKLERTLPTRMSWVYRIKHIGIARKLSRRYRIESASNPDPGYPADCQC